MLRLLEIYGKIKMASLSAFEYSRLMENFSHVFFLFLGLVSYDFFSQNYLNINGS